MLIVKREEFVRMPAGTIFAPWHPNCFMGIFRNNAVGTLA